MLTTGTVLGVLTPVAGSTAAWADGPQHVKSTVSIDDVQFRLASSATSTRDDAGTVSDNSIIFPDKTIDQIEASDHAHESDTGFTLPETDHFVCNVTAGRRRTSGFSGTFGMPMERSLWSRPGSWCSQPKAKF